MTIAASSLAGDIVWLSPLPGREDRFHSVGGHRLFVLTPEAFEPSPKYRFPDDLLALVARRTGRSYGLRERRLTLFPAPPEGEGVANARLFYFELLDDGAPVARFATGSEAVRHVFERLLPTGTRVQLRSGGEAFMEAWMEDAFDRSRVVGRFQDGRVFSCTPTRTPFDWNATLNPL